MAGIMSSLCSSSEDSSDSDEEVPVVQPCYLPLAELQTADLNTTGDISLLLAVLGTGDEVRALAAVSKMCKLLPCVKAKDKDWAVQAVIEAGGVEILCRAMKHESKRIRIKATLAVSYLYNGFFKQVKKLCKPGYVQTLVEVINTDKSWKAKKTAILAFKNIARFYNYCSTMLEAGGLAAILSHLRVNSRSYMLVVCQTLYQLTSNNGYPFRDPYKHQISAFILSHLNAFTDRETRYYIFLTFQELAWHYTDDIGLNKEICSSLIPLIDTTDENTSCALINAVSEIIIATSEFTELFIECGLLGKIQELLRNPNCSISYTICFFLGDISEQGSDIVDKVVLSGIIPHLISLIGSNLFSSIDKNVSNVLGKICFNCSSTLIPQLLEIDIIKYLVQNLSEMECIKGLRGIIRYCKEVSNPELLKSYVNVEELTKTCRELVSNGKSEAKGLQKDLGWVRSGGRKAKAPRKKHKIAK